MNTQKKALVIVDPQLDFIEGGALAVTGGKAAMRSLTEKLNDNAFLGKYDLIVVTQDWHIDPGSHWAAEGVEPNYTDTWPVHCAAGTSGAEIYGPLAEKLVELSASGVPVFMVRKGQYEASYSGFEGTIVGTMPTSGSAETPVKSEHDGSTLTDFFKGEGVSHLEVVGLAFDYCVAATSKDSATDGFDTKVIQEFTASVSTDNVRNTIDALENTGAVVERDYRVSSFPAFAATVDLVVMTLNNGRLDFLAVKRGNAPFKGNWALPGGFTQVDETLDTAAERELAEETGVVSDAGFLEQLKTYYSPGRDPRMPTVSTAYVAVLREPCVIEAGDDAADVAWLSVDDVMNGEIELSFDHIEILRDGLDRLRSKLEYTTVGAAFLPEQFTLGDLRRVYETVWGVKLHPSNFRRKVLGTKGFVLPLDSKGIPATSGNKAALYSRGKATLLHPAILRDCD